MQTFLRELEVLKTTRDEMLSDEEHATYGAMLDNLVVKLRRGDYHNSAAMVSYLMAVGAPSSFGKRVGDGEFEDELRKAGCFPTL